MKRKIVPFLAGLAFLAACSDGPTGTSETAETGSELVITQGAEAPAPMPRLRRPSLSETAAAASVGGSSTTPLSLKPQSCDAGQQVVVTYTITGRQVNAASFKVNTVWTYDGASWSGSNPQTVNVAARPVANAAASIYQVTVTVVNASGTNAGTSSFAIAPFDLSTTSPATLVISGGNVTVHVAFAACPVTNTPPSLVLPNDLTVEASSSAGATVNFVVTASDAQDGDLTASVVCTPASGSVFALGTHTVNCSVTDGGGLSASGSFTVKVEDTTPAYFTSFPTGTINLIAADINGAVLDIDALGITAEDVGNVSEPSTFGCDYAAGTVLGIGSTTTVSCTAEDAIGNESAASTFDVFVGLDVSGIGGFLMPLRMEAPFSIHKRGSTIPHKFLAPKYADGTPATDLAADLRLALNRIDGTVELGGIEVNEYSAGSTVWRYDVDAGHYIFNLKTLTAWDVGTWRTTVSYKGIVLATTKFDLKK